MAASLCCNAPTQDEILKKVPHDVRSGGGCDRQSEPGIGSFEDSINRSEYVSGE